MPYRTFSIQEVARYLHLSGADVERLVHDREIPFEKHGERVVFRKVEIDAWASPRVLGMQGRRLVEYCRTTSRNTRELLPEGPILDELVQPDFIEPVLPAKTKASVLREMVELADRTGRVWDKPALLAGLQAREALGSTGLPGGLALLHIRQPESYLFESLFVVLGRSRQQIPFGAPDGRPTDLFFLVASPDARLHLHALARICLVVQKTDLLAQLRQAPDAGAMHQYLLAAERMALDEVLGKP